MEDKLDLKLEALIAEIVELQGAIHALSYYIQEMVRWSSSDSILITGAVIVATVGLRTVGVCDEVSSLSLFDVASWFWILPMPARF